MDIRAGGRPCNRPGSAFGNENTGDFDQDEACGAFSSHVAGYTVIVALCVGGWLLG